MRYSEKPCTVYVHVQQYLGCLPLLTHRYLVCIRKEISDRLTALKVPLLYLPNFTTDPPTAPTPFLPIHCTPLSLLRKKDNIVVLVNRAREDLGVLSYRVLSKSGGVNAGSAVSIVRELYQRAVSAAKTNGTAIEEEMPGIVILNTGQLLFSHQARRAVTPTSWDALPRKSATHPPARIHEKWNRVEGNKTIEEHVQYVFEKLLANDKYVDPEAQLYIMGIGEGGDEVLKYLDGIKNEEPGHHRHNVAALALTASVPTYAGTSEISFTGNDNFLRFLAQRSRAWCLSEHELGTPLANQTPVADIKTRDENEAAAMQEIDLTPKVAGGEKEIDELIVAIAYRQILQWFNEVASADVATLAKQLTISEAVKKSLEMTELQEGW